MRMVEQPGHNLPIARMTVTQPTQLDPVEGEQRHLGTGKKRRAAKQQRNPGQLDHDIAGHDRNALGCSRRLARTYLYREGVIARSMRRLERGSSDSPG